MDKKHIGGKLQFRHIGSGFIMTPAVKGMVAGRKLTKTYADQYNRTYVKVNGGFEPISAEHAYIGAE